MIDKIWRSADSAIADIEDGSVIGIGGFGGAGVPQDLIDALIRKAPRDLVIVTNNAGSGETGIAALLQAGLVRRIICSYPRMPGSHVFETLYRADQIELEVTPQGNMAERLRAAGAGIAAFYTRTGYGTLLAEGKETREFDGRSFVLEHPIKLDYALVKAEQGDRWGNLTYRKTARNFGPVMAMAAKRTIASVHTIVDVGFVDPESVVTPGIFVSKVVQIDRVATQAGGFKKAA